MSIELGTYISIGSLGQLRITTEPTSVDNVAQFVTLTFYTITSTVGSVVEVAYAEDIFGSLTRNTYRADEEKLFGEAAENYTFIPESEWVLNVSRGHIAYDGEVKYTVWNVSEFTDHQEIILKKRI